MQIDRLKITEVIVLDKADVVTRADGAIMATPRVGRIGIQLYRGSELGRADLDTVRVWRPESEVMDKAAMASVTHRPVTNNHPTEPVTTDNWKKYAVGHTGETVARDGEYIRVPMMLSDGAAIADYHAGKKELSLGYTSNLEWRSGETPAGEKYDAVQTNIRINHLALVDAARGGPKLAIGDAGPDADVAALVAALAYDYNHNHDPATGEFSEGGGAAEASVLSKAMKNSPAFQPTSVEHAKALGTATSKAQLRGELHALGQNKNLSAKKFEGLKSVVKRYTGSEPSSNTKAGLLAEITKHWNKTNGWRSDGAFLVDGVDYRAALESIKGQAVTDRAQPVVLAVDDLLNLMDVSKRKTKMTEKTLTTIMIDNASLEVVDSAASAILRKIEALTTALADAEKKYAFQVEKGKKAEEGAAAAEEENGKKKKKMEEDTATIATLKQQLADAQITPQKLDELVRDRSTVIAKGRATIGDKLVIDGKTNAEMRKQVVAERLGDACKDWSDDMVASSFATLTADVKVDALNAADHMRNTFSGAPSKPTSSADSHAKYEKRISDAWRGEAKQ